MTIHILTIFPDFFTSPLQTSILKRAQADAHVVLNIVDIRQFATDKHQTTDDRPYGGGPGMVMKVEPIALAVEGIQKKLTGQSTGTTTTRVILTSAKGQLFTQKKAQAFSEIEDLIIICGHYEGVDERVAEYVADEEVRIGDYVLTGGEAAAIVIADAVSRLIPGVLGNEESNQNESHSEPGRLAHPQYTRPEKFRDWSVPEVLLSGHSANIEKWRKKLKNSPKTDILAQ
jgi:tRNA (guanine37-N1)-methyltransferase